MRIDIISIATLRDFIQQNVQASKPIYEWIQKVRHAGWNTPEDILQTFPTADLLGRGTRRVVFNIGGNKYRLICSYAFSCRRVRLYVCWIGSHADYTKLCKDQEQYTVSDY